MVGSQEMGLEVYLKLNLGFKEVIKNNENENKSKIILDNNNSI